VVDWFVRRKAQYNTHFSREEGGRMLQGGAENRRGSKRQRLRNHGFVVPKKRARRPGIKKDRGEETRVVSRQPQSGQETEKWKENRAERTAGLCA